MEQPDRLKLSPVGYESTMLSLTPELLGARTENQTQTSPIPRECANRYHYSGLSSNFYPPPGFILDIHPDMVLKLVFNVFLYLCLHTKSPICFSTIPLRELCCSSHFMEGFFLISVLASRGFRVTMRPTGLMCAVDGRRGLVSCLTPFTSPPRVRPFTISGCYAEQ